MASMGYKGLRVYQEAHRLAVEVHRMTPRLPRYEMLREGSQVRRSSKSVAANIVEGYGRRAYKQDYLRFLVYAHASCGETREHLELLHDCGSLSDDAFRQLHAPYESLGRDLYYFTESVARQHVLPSTYRKPSSGDVVREEAAAYATLDEGVSEWLEGTRLRYEE